MERLAVQCDTEDEWRKVKSKTGFSLQFPLPEDESGPISITIGGDYNGGYGSNECNIDLGYKIITAQEYLSEGGKDVSKFKKGDRVECINRKGYTHIAKGEIYTIKSFNSYDSLILEELEDCYSYVPECFKVVASIKTQTTKENNMNINSSIRTVLVEENKETFETVEKFQKVFGGEIAENFTGAMILRKNIKAYNDEIKRLDDIEAKRLEKEEKEGK